MITNEDLKLTAKMLAEVGKLVPVRSTTSWTSLGERRTSDCWRCDRCEAVLGLGTDQVGEDVLACHLVLEHGYTYDGLTPEEFKEACE